MTKPDPTVHGRTRAELGFRPLTRADFPLLARWFAAPHVAPWWREDPDPAAIAARYTPTLDGRDPTRVYLILLNTRPVGFIQRYRLTDNPDWATTLQPAFIPATTTASYADPPAAAGIDYLLGEPQLTGHGLGPVVIDRFTTATFTDYPEIDTVVVAVNQANRRSWRALEKAGYHRVYTGPLESDDPSDTGINHIYLRPRHQPSTQPAPGTPAAPSPGQSAACE
ncbi:MAG TPA: GNAT family N-acetyltransferase [Streptosporangiaceae bacterium]|nr:GNAT family N-acetyltransferase [Streptosporangiaceae bacterium]